MSVYFAQVGHYIKIGFSRNPERRVRRLMASETRYGRPYDAPADLASRHLIRTIAGTKVTESRVHAALDDFCVGLEWFVDEPQVRHFIEHVARQDDVNAEYAHVPRPAGPCGYQLAPEVTADDAARLDAALACLFATSEPALSP